MIGVDVSLAEQTPPDSSICDDTLTCSVCFTGDKNYAAVPCGHHVGTMWAPCGHHVGTSACVEVAHLRYKRKVRTNVLFVVVQ